MRHRSLGNGGERNELPKMRSDVSRGSRILPLVRNAPERDRPPHAPGGTGREQGARRRHHGARPRGERTPADVQQSGGDPASGRRGGWEGDERGGRGGHTRGRGHLPGGQGSRGQDRRGREARGHEGHRKDWPDGPQDTREGSKPVGNPGEPRSPIQTVFYATGPSGFVGRTARVSVGRLLPVLLAALAIFAGTASGTAPRPLASPAGALVVTFDIPVDPGAADYVHRAAQAAIASNQDLVIVMNTPGGLLSNMVQIINSTQEVQNHGLAVYTFVPPAAFVASAGSYIALASNAIYMGNASVIGPSTPYIIGGDPSQVQHVQNFAKALITSLAQAHGYNVTAAIDMAQNNTAFSGSEAAAIGLVTGMAQSLNDFL